MIERAFRLYTAKQVRRLDRCAIDGHGIPGMDLMENAGRSAFEAALEAFPGSHNILVFCGGGNNGGDGYVIARLARKAGLRAGVCALKDPATLAGDAATAAQRWMESGGEVQSWSGAGPDDCDLVFDALLGTGLDREPAGDYASAIDWINGSGKPVVAVDIPSGLHADTGVAMGRAVEARLTVTFIGNKRGLFTSDGPDHAGTVKYSHLDTPGSVADSEPDSGILIQEKLISELLPERRRNTHKGSYGWLLGVGGGDGMSGAIRLAGEAALRSGAGKVTLATRAAHAGLVNLGCPELMVRGVENDKQIDELSGQVDVIVTGTGLGQTAWSRRMIASCLNASAPLVIDADGLNLLAAMDERSRPQPNSDWILTPHPAEAARLLGNSTREVQSDRVGAASAIASRYNAIVVLKGCGTIVAAPGGRYAICPFGNPGMATAGAGDVLTGVIGGLVAQGVTDPWQAAMGGALAHALAGDRAAAELGERGMLASDIIRRLPAVLNPH